MTHLSRVSVCGIEARARPFWQKSSPTHPAYDDKSYGLDEEIFRDEKAVRISLPSTESSTPSGWAWLHSTPSDPQGRAAFDDDLLFVIPRLIQGIGGCHAVSWQQVILTDGQCTSKEIFTLLFPGSVGIRHPLDWFPNRRPKCSGINRWRAHFLLLLYRSLLLY